MSKNKSSRPMDNIWEVRPVKADDNHVDNGYSTYEIIVPATGEVLIGSFVYGDDKDVKETAQHIVDLHNMEVRGSSRRETWNAGYKKAKEYFDAQLNRISEEKIPLPDKTLIKEGLRNYILQKYPNVFNMDHFPDEEARDKRMDEIYQLDDQVESILKSILERA